MAVNVGAKRAKVGYGYARYSVRSYEASSSVFTVAIGLREEFKVERVFTYVVLNLELHDQVKVSPNDLRYTPRENVQT